MYDRYPELPERKDELVMILYAVLMFVFAALLLLTGIMTCLGGYDLIYDYALNRVTDLRRYAKANGIALICLCLPLIACGVLMLVQPEIPLALIGLGILVVGIVVDYIFCHRIQTKYNGGMF